MARNRKTAEADVPPRSLNVASVRVEFPKEHETVSGPDYTFSIFAPQDSASVDLCIDKGDWLACRESVGLWWYDWSGFDDGEYEAVARIRKADGTVLLSERRIFSVKRR